MEPREFHVIQSHPIKTPSPRVEADLRSRMESASAEFDSQLLEGHLINHTKPKLGKAIDFQIQSTYSGLRKAYLRKREPGAKSIMCSHMSSKNIQ